MINVMILVLATTTASAVPASDPAAWTPELRQKVEKVLDRATAVPQKLTAVRQEAQRARGGPVAVMEGVTRYPRYEIDEDIYGCVIVSFEILPDGKADGFEVVSATPPGVFDTVALRIMLATRFERTERLAKGAERPRHRKGVFVLLPRPAPTAYTTMNRRNEDERNKKRDELRTACEASAS